MNGTLPVTSTLREEVLQFGSNRRLLGILSRPEKPTPGLPALLIPNTGLDHRVGPNRLHVNLARALADAGYCVLRLDLSGLGDSHAAGGGSDGSADLQAAMDELQRRGFAGRFVILGLCSGAHDAHQLARKEERVSGIAFLDGYAYPTPRFKLLHWFNRLAEPARVWRWLQGRWSRKSVAEAGFMTEDIEYFVPPPQEQVAADYEAFIARGMAMTFIYTGGMPNDYNYREQLFDSFPALHDRVQLHYLAHADHTFSHRETRAELVRLLSHWVSHAFPADGSAVVTGANPAR